MARAPSIVQRISLDGGPELEQLLKRIGKVGEEAFKNIQAEAEKVKGPGKELAENMRQVADQLDQVGRKFDQLGRKIQNVGRTVTTYITLPIAAAFAGVLKVSGDFEAGMNRVQAATGATAEEFTALRDIALEMGEETQFSAIAAAEGIEQLAKNGQSAAQIIDGSLRATLDLAAASGVQLGEAANVITDSMASFKIDAVDLGRVVNQVTGVLIASKFEFQDYALAIGQAGGVAGAAGVSFEDFNAVLAATSNLFSSGSDAGTAFRNFIIRLNPQSKEAADEIQRMGLSFFDAAGNLKPMEQIAQELRDTFVGLNEETRNLALVKIFGTDAIRTAVGLIDQGADGIRRLNNELALANAAEQARIRLEGLNGAFIQLKTALIDLGIAIGDSGVLAFFTALVEGTTSLVKVLGDLPTPILAIVGIIAGLLAIVGPFLIALGTLIRLWGFAYTSAAQLARGLAFLAVNFTSLVTAFRGVQIAGAAILAFFGSWAFAITALVAALAFLVFEVVKNWDQIKAAFTSSYNAIVNGLRNFGNRLREVWKSALQSLVNAVSPIITPIIGFFQAIAGGIVSTWNGLVEIFTSFVGSIVDLFSGLMDSLFGMWDDLYDKAKGVLDSIIDWLGNVIEDAARAARAITDAAGITGGGEGLRFGGQVRGAGSSTSDSIPAWLSTREFVVKAAAVRKYGAGLFHSLNSMRFSPSQLRFSLGGLVNDLGAAMSMSPLRMADGGLVAASSMGSGRPFNLVIDGQTFANLRAPTDVADELIRFSRARQVRSAGRKPAWYGAR